MAYQPGPSYRPQGLDPDAHAQAIAGAQAVGRTSPMPPVPSVAQSNIGQPGQFNHPTGGMSPGGMDVQMGNAQHNYAGGMSPSSPGGATPTDKGPDYVWVDRRPNQFSEETRGKATAAKMKLELYYKEAVEGVVGRKER